MSIIKIMRKGVAPEIEVDAEIAGLRYEFIADFDLYTVATDSNVKQERIIDMIITYSKISYLYLYSLGLHFKYNPEIKDFLSIANSIIAEGCREIKLPYFHIDGGYSIIDKCVAFTMDDKYEIEPADVLHILEEMMTPEEVEEVSDEASN